MSLLKSNSVQIGQSATATQNFTLSVPSSPDGTIKLARGNSGATTADVLTVDASGNVTTTLATGSVKFSQLSTSATEADNVASRTAKAWVNFNGTGTVAIRASFNVSSITDNSTGNFTVTFATAFADANYCFAFGSQTSGIHDFRPVVKDTDTIGSSSFVVLNAASTGVGTFNDPLTFCVTIFR